MTTDYKPRGDEKEIVDFVIDRHLRNHLNPPTRLVLGRDIAAAFFEALRPMLTYRNDAGACDQYRGCKIVIDTSEALVYVS